MFSNIHPLVLPLHYPGGRRNRGRPATVVRPVRRELAVVVSTDDVRQLTLGPLVAVDEE